METEKTEWWKTEKLNDEKLKKTKWWPVNHKRKLTDDDDLRRALRNTLLWSKDRPRVPPAGLRGQLSGATRPRLWTPLAYTREREAERWFGSDHELLASSFSHGWSGAVPISSMTARVNDCCEPPINSVSIIGKKAPSLLTIGRKLHQ